VRYPWFVFPPIKTTPKFSASIVDVFDSSLSPQRNCHVLCENGALKLALDILPSVQNEVLFGAFGACLCLFAT
jgi:hypothetical protein